MEVGNSEVEICSLNHFRNSTADFALPASVLLVQDDVLASDPQHTFVAEYDQSLFVVRLIDHCDSATEHRHAVALLQRALPLAADIILVACLDQVVSSLLLRHPTLRSGIT
jgi:hypothetical protein